jgi:cell division protein FtsW
VWPELPKRCWVAVLLAVGLTVIQPDLGTASVVLGSGVITMIVAGVRWQSLVLFMAALCAVVLLAVAVAPNRFDYAFDRLHTWMHPRADVEGDAYQITQSRGAIAAGGLFGRGFLKSEQKMNRLPLCTKDFVFPVIVEELGYIGGMGVILLFVSLAWVGLRLSLLSRDPFNRTVIAALGLNICLQGLVNVGTTTGALPLSGLTLPFFSEGGSSLVVSLCALGTMYALGLSELAQARAEGAPAAAGVPGGAPVPPLR